MSSTSVVDNVMKILNNIQMQIDLYTRYKSKLPEQIGSPDNCQVLAVHVGDTTKGRHMSQVPHEELESSGEKKKTTTTLSESNQLEVYFIIIYSLDRSTSSCHQSVLCTKQTCSAAEATAEWRHGFWPAFHHL